MQLTNMLAGLIARESGCAGHRTLARARVLSQKINGLTTSAFCEIWQKRTLVRGTKPPSGNKSNRDEGTMTFAEFLTLPKPHQMNKVKKVLRTMHGFTNKKDTVVYLPKVGQNVRSYTLQKDQCVSQCGVIKAYTRNSDAPYKVENTQDASIHIDCTPERNNL